MGCGGNQQVMSILSADPSTRPTGSHPVADHDFRSLIVSIDPATGTENGSVTCATSEDVETAVHAARSALHGWRRTAPGVRAAALRAAAADLRSDADRIAELHMRDTGRLLTDARSAVDVAASLFEEAATVAPLDAGRSLGGDRLALDVVRREPR